MQAGLGDAGLGDDDPQQVTLAFNGQAYSILPSGWVIDRPICQLATSTTAGAWTARSTVKVRSISANKARSGWRMKSPPGAFFLRGRADAFGGADCCPRANPPSTLAKARSKNAAPAASSSGRGNSRPCGRRRKKVPHRRKNGRLPAVVPPRPTPLGEKQPGFLQRRPRASVGSSSSPCAAKASASSSPRQRG